MNDSCTAPEYLVTVLAIQYLTLYYMSFRMVSVESKQGFQDDIHEKLPRQQQLRYVVMTQLQGHAEPQVLAWQVLSGSFSLLAPKL